MSLSILLLFYQVYDFAIISTVASPDEKMMYINLYTPFLILQRMNKRK